MADRYCSNCENELGMEAQFCSGCGRPAHETARITTPEADVPRPARSSRPPLRAWLPQGVFFIVVFIVIVVVYAGAVLSIGSLIAIAVLFVVGALTGSSAITFIVTGVVMVIYLILAVLFFIGFLRIL